MGVPGLLRMATTKTTPERINLTTLASASGGSITLAVDVCALSYHLYRSMRIPFVTGGDYAALAVAVTNYVHSLRCRRVELYGVVDGMRESGKASTTRARLEKAAADMCECVRCVDKFGSHADAFDARGPFVPPPLMVAQVIGSLREQGVPVERASREADARLSYLARRPGGSCFAVLSNDSDFLVFDCCSPLIRFEDISLADPFPPEHQKPFAVARLYHRSSVAKTLGIEPRLMPALASLVGTDSAPARQELHDRLSSRGRSRRRGASSCDVVMSAAAFLIGAMPSEESGREAMLRAASSAEKQFDAALVSLLFGSSVGKTQSRKRGQSRKQNRSKKQRTSQDASWVEHINTGRVVYHVFNSGAVAESIPLSGTAEHPLNPKASFLLNKSNFREQYLQCGYITASRLAQICTDKKFHWGRPPLEASPVEGAKHFVGIYEQFLPLRKRLYAFLFGSTTDEKNAHPSTSTMPTVAGTSLMECLRVGKKYRWEYIDFADECSTILSLSPIGSEHILSGFNPRHASHESSKVPWCEIDGEKPNFLPRKLCQLVWESEPEMENAVLKQLQECYSIMANALPLAYSNPPQEVSFCVSGRRSTIVPGDFLQRLTLYSKLQVAYIHLCMVTQVFGGAQPALPSRVFRGLPSWVLGCSENTKE